MRSQCHYSLYYHWSLIIINNISQHSTESLTHISKSQAQHSRVVVWIIPWPVRRCSGGVLEAWALPLVFFWRVDVDDGTVTAKLWHATASTESSRSTSREKGCHHLQEYSILEKYSNVFDNIFKVYKLYYIDANTLNI